MEQKVRAHAIITGRVQGVFFRYETMQAAQERGVFGWVKNRRDGSVEALFEGTKESVAAVLKWCRQGPPLANVKNVAVEWEAYTGEFNRFDITH